MQVYIAGSSRELDRVKRIEWLINEYNKTAKPEQQIQITAKWWDVITARGDANPVDAPYHERLKYANDDLDGVRSADVLWLLYPSRGQTSVGCFWEAGYADALGMEIVISGPGQANSIFTTRGASYDSDYSVMEYLASIAFHGDIANDPVYAVEA